MPKKHPSHNSLGLGRWIHIKPRARSGIQMLRVSSGCAGWIVLQDKHARVLALHMPSVFCASQLGCETSCMKGISEVSVEISVQCMFEGTARAQCELWQLKGSKRAPPSPLTASSFSIPILKITLLQPPGCL